MISSMQLTREIYWSPLGKLNAFLHQTTYFWLAIALIIMSYGIWRQTILWRKGKKEVVFDRPLLRIGFFF